MRPSTPGAGVVTNQHLLPSWRPGATRDAVLEFLDHVVLVPLPERLACFDNDGTLWCERPTYVQLDFFLDALKRRVAEEPGVAEVPEYAVLLGGDRVAIGELGLERIAVALTALFEGRTPVEFARLVQEFMRDAPHHTLGRPHRTCLYQPMLELIDALRRREVTVAIVTGGGTEFVRAVSRELYGIPPESVVGTLVAYDYGRDSDGRPALWRTARVSGAGNEGPVKVSNIQAQLGRRPIVAAGNSGGDREMLEWAAAFDGPSLALLLDHDDPEREFAYVSTAQTFEEPEPITEVAARLGWTVVSMARDWEEVFLPRD